MKKNVTLVLAVMMVVCSLVVSTIPMMAALPEISAKTVLMRVGQSYALKMKNIKTISWKTSGSSGISGSLPHIRILARDATVRDGKDLTDTSKEDVKDWIAGISTKIY